MPAISTAPGFEWSVLLAACSTAADPATKRAILVSAFQQPVRWPELSALADLHGVQPLLEQALQIVADRVPAEPLQLLKQRCQSNLHRALLLSLELIRIVQRLSDLGIEVMPYKGLALAELLYGDIGLRQSGDIDLLIHTTDLPRIRKIVSEFGYVPHERFANHEERAYLESGYELSFDGPAGPNLLELQWGILPRFYAVDFDIAGFFARGLNIEVAGFAMKTPSPSDLLLILSAHAAKHVYGRLIWLCDVARLMQRPDLDWDWLQSQAETLGLVRTVRVTLELAHQLLQAPLTAGTEKSFPASAAATTLVRQIGPQIGGGLFEVESLAYFKLMMNLRERRSDQARFLSRLLFTPGPSEWRAVALPAPLFPLYRAVRLGRLALRLARA
jgi:putative nucleotidyltransferase-like protein